MTTLVTGAAGFVGRNVIERLLAEKHDVIAADLPPVAHLDPSFVVPGVTYRCGDLRDDAFVRSLFASSHIRAVIHLATVTANGADERDRAAAMIEVNVLAVERLLAAAARSGSPRVVYVGSGSAYGRAWDSTLSLTEESSPSQPETLYGITKLAGEAVALRLGELHGLDVRAVRLGSVFGPWERETAAREAMSIFLQIGRFALRRERVVLPREIHARDWIYSRDAAMGLVALTHAVNPRFRLYHLTSGLEWTRGLLHWCEALAAAIDGFTYRQAEIGEQPNVRDSAVRDRAPMRVDRVRADIGFVPQFGPEAAARDYAEWLLRHPMHVGGASSLAPGRSLSANCA